MKDQKYNLSHGDDVYSIQWYPGNISIAAEPNEGSLAYSRLIEMVKVIASRLQRMAAAYIEQGLY